MHTKLLVDRKPDLCPVRKIPDLNCQTRTKSHAFDLVEVVQVADLELSSDNKRLLRQETTPSRKPTMLRLLLGSKPIARQHLVVVENQRSPTFNRFSKRINGSCLGIE
jgi:hypothetical protein